MSYTLILLYVTLSRTHTNMLLDILKHIIVIFVINSHTIIEFKYEQRPFVVFLFNCGPCYVHTTPILSLKTALSNLTDEAVTLTVSTGYKLTKDIVY